MSTDATERAFPLPLLRAKPSLALEEPGTSDPAIGDDELLERIRQRDERSALMLFHRYNKLALSIGYRVLRDEGEAEDLAQEFFLRLCSVADSFDATKGSARTWIIQMIYRRAFDRRAYLRRRQFYLGTETEDHANTLVGGQNPENAMLDRLTVEQFKTAFSDLTDRQRGTLEMFFFEGMGFAEIAERTGEDVKNIRHHYYRGLERLRQSVRRIMMRGRKLKP